MPRIAEIEAQSIYWRRMGDLLIIIKIATPAIVAGFLPVSTSNFEMLSAVALQTSITSGSSPSFKAASSAYLEDD